ncbi:MAG TPA: BTAD domain-containing putative transcriptional regulator [Jatrophihabitantaceae bacterium]|jgi:DNA-binding response OmpR family regulator
MNGDVLVVDDTAANVRLFEAILTTHGHTVRAASNGPDALAIIASDAPPDLVLLDIQMDGMDGYEVCRRIRADERTTMLPVIMVTASGNDEKVHSLESGADDFIARPFDQAELLARVRSLLRIKRYHDTVLGQSAELAAWNRLLEEQVNEQVEEVQRLQRLRRFLSANVADAVISSGDESLLEPHRREVALLFCDLRGFTHFASAAEPEEVLVALQSYHEVIGEIVKRHSATVGYFAGDGVMMFFNDPFPCADPALRAVTAAAELRDAMQLFADRWQQRGHRLGIGAGVTFGFATLGLIGFEGRYEYTAIGPMVNLAARLCDEAHAGEILVGQRALAAVQDRIRVLARGEVELRGIDGMTPLWAFDGLVGAVSPAAGATAPKPPVPSQGAGAPQNASAGTGDLDRAAGHAFGMPPSRSGLDFRVLGPLEVSVANAAVPLRGVKVRELLSLLLLHRGRVVSVDRLAEELWTGEPPAAATAALRVYVSRLRKLLSGAGQERLLVTHPSAYQLDAPDDALDVVRFETLAGQGRAALRSGDPSAAVQLLRAATGLWRGAAYQDIATTPSAEADSVRLEESRLEAVEDCIEAELACGNHRSVLGELQALVGAHPLRERLWSQRMTALYRAGRQPEALGAYQEFRQHLADELGLDPSPELAQLHAAILSRSAELEPTH